MSLSNIISIVGIFVTIIGFYITVKELSEMRKQREQERKSIRLENSIECAKEFQKLIDENLSFILDCVSEEQFNRIIDQIVYTDISIFDRKEFEQLAKK